MQFKGKNMPVIVNVGDKRWNKYKVDFKRIAEKSLGDEYRESEISILLTNDNEIRKLNKKYRGIDSPTNVLSFETKDKDLLGDVVISFDSTMREAGKKNFINHLTHLIVHGILHLQGFDHLEDDNAKIMEGREIKILRKMKIANPYGDPFGIWKKIGLMVLGAVASYGFAPHYFWWMAALSIGAAYYLNKGYKTGFWWGAGYSALSFSWSLESIFASAEIARQMWYFYPIGLVAIAVLGGALFGLPFFMTARTESRGWRRTLYFALAWTFGLWVWQWFLTGFPWNPIANLAINNIYISQWNPIIGAVGLTFIIIGCICSIPEFLMTRAKWQFLFFIPISLSFLLPRWHGEAHGLRVRLIQPAFSMDYKFNSELIDLNIQRMVEMSKTPPSFGAEPDMIVWPETSYPYIIYSGKKLPPLGIPMAAGVIYSDGVDLYNGLALADGDGNINDIYLKAHLVPFGEYRVLWKLVPTHSDLKSGPGPKLMGDFAPAICYEIIFSDSLIPRGSEPKFILNISNDGWFGTSSGPYQHLDMARLQALETGLPVIRANHIGISAIIDANGNVLQSIPHGKSGILDGVVPGHRNTVYRNIGLNNMMLIIIFLCGFILAVFRRKSADS
ncbi:MAG: apolipoprotein N-acyltransferase [Rickettsiales bacterium]|jgi:apolipoprotein N-acyltransferase|nr:apolipoprotein N-acyltransferase [Rickettsiales bacterium]